MNRRRRLWRVVDGAVRPLAVVPGEWPEIRMGPGPWPRVDEPAVGAQEELEHGQVTRSTGVGTLPVAAPPLDRSAFLPDLLLSGARGAPLTLLRRFRVGGGAGALEVVQTPMPGPDLTPARPATDLTHYYPWLFGPGPDGSEFPIVSVNAPVVVGAGASVNLITIQELPRGLRGVVKKFGQTAADFTNLAWSFLIKGKPTPPIVALLNFQFGTLSLPVDLPGSGVHLRSGDDFVVQVTNSGAAAVAGVRARVDLYWWRDNA